MAKKAAYGGHLTALALIFSYIEFLVPVNIGVPGIKLGLANIVVIIVLYKLGLKYAFAINVVRILVAALLFSGVFGMLFALAGGILGLSVMGILRKFEIFSITGVSIAGGVAHNMGQMAAAVFVMSNAAILYYLPVLLISGALAGTLIGIIAQIILNRV